MLIPVVYWSGTGNTEKMAEAIAEAIAASGREAKLLPVNETNACDIAKYDTIVLGCPAMGCEQLEECEFEPFMAELELSLIGKRVALFGSYGWGGSYMEEWRSRCENAGAKLVYEPVLAQDAPDEEALSACALLAAACCK